MLGRLGGSPDPMMLPTAERVRLEHESWLRWAFGRPAGMLPRIPVRRVSAGGFDAIMATPGGRAWAASWWGRAFDRVELGR